MASKRRAEPQSWMTFSVELRVWKGQRQALVRVWTSSRDGKDGLGPRTLISEAQYALPGSEGFRVSPEWCGETVADHMRVAFPGLF